MYILRLRARILSVVLASLCILGGCSSIQEGAQMHVSSGYFFQAESSSISITGSSVPGGSVSSTPRENDQVLETKEILNKASAKPYKALLSKTYDEKELLAFSSIGSPIILIPCCRMPIVHFQWSVFELWRGPALIVFTRPNKTGWFMFFINPARDCSSLRICSM